MTTDTVDIVLRLRRQAQFQKDAAASRKAIDRTADSVRRTGRTMHQSKSEGRGFADMLQNLRRPLGLLTSGLAMLGVRQAVNEMREATRVGRDTSAVIKSMSAASWTSADAIGDLAGKMALKNAIDDDAIQKGMNVLLTFRNIQDQLGKGNNVFERASQAAVDLSARYGKDLNQSMVMIGKAVNDPIKGLTALGRTGIQFTKQQKDQIATLVESGKTLEAQKLILSELESQTAGSAAAQADPLQRLGVAWGELMESVGMWAAPAISGVASFMSDLVTQLRNGTGPAGALAGGIATIWRALNDLVSGFKQGKTWAVLLVGGVAALTSGFAAYQLVVGITAAKTAALALRTHLLNIALWANPIGLVIAAIVALVAVFVVAYLKVGWFREGVNKAWSVIKTVFSWSPLGLVMRNFGAVVEFIKGLPGRIASAASGMFNGIKDAFRSAINWIIQKWNDLAISLGPVKIPFAPDIPQIRVDTPNIPMLAMGGVVSGMGSWISGEAGPELNTMLSSGQVRVQPLSGGELAGAMGGTIVIESNTYLDGEVIARSTSRHVADEHARRRG